MCILPCVLIYKKFFVFSFADGFNTTKFTFYDILMTKLEKAPLSEYGLGTHFRG